MKKIILPILIIFLTFTIYKVNDNNLIDYMVIGDSLNLGLNSYGNIGYGYNDYIKSYLENNQLLHQYNDLFTKENYKIEELTSDIQNNKSLLYDDKTYTFKKELREADLVTIAIGMDELVEILNQEIEINYSNLKADLDKICLEMDNLIKEITSFSKTEIILIGYYNPTNEETKDIERIFAYLNQQYENIAKKYSIIYLDIYETIKKDKNYLPNKNDYHLTSKGYLQIAKEIIKKIEE